MGGWGPDLADKKFSIVMPLRDAPSERRFAVESIPAALNPNEFVVVVDAPATESLASHIRRILRREDKLRIIQVLYSNEWSFHLCHVMWECYMQCKHDCILTCYVDQILLPSVEGMKHVGQNNVAVASLTIRILVRRVLGFIRYLFYLRRVRASADVFTGLYWIYRPFYFEDMDKTEYERIRNGMDTWMHGRIKNLGRHGIVTLKTVGCKSLDYQNEDYPWRQFQKGVWMYVHRQKRRMAKKQQRRGLWLTWPYKTLSDVLDRCYPTLDIWLYASIHQHPWILRGAKWAAENTDHAAVRTARDKSLTMYECSGSEYIRDVCYRDKAGRRGTGFG